MVIVKEREFRLSLRRILIVVDQIRLYRGERVIQPKLTFYRKLALYDVVDVAKALSVCGKSDIVRSAANRFLTKCQFV
jgi:hypothetical protein